MVSKRKGETLQAFRKRNAEYMKRRYSPKERNRYYLQGREKNLWRRREYSKKYYEENKEKVIERNKEYYSNNPEARERRSIRASTRQKYGKPPKGKEYHHTIPYHIDKWKLIEKEKHNREHRRYK